MKKKNKIKLFLNTSIILVSLLVLMLFGGYYVFLAPNIKNIDDKSYVYIRDNDNLENIIIQLKQNFKVSNQTTLKWVAKILNYDENIRSGRYSIHNNTSNLELIRKLRGGKQEPLSVSFNNIRTKSQLASRLSSQLMADSISIDALLNDTAFLKQYNLNEFTAISLFIPNTYEFYWDTDSNELFERMKKEYDKFWDETRISKAQKIPMTQAEVMTLASIIEEETKKRFEYPIIAGLYINRLKKKMPLQACPTIKFALGDFKLQRILTKHTKFDSPYNTYQNLGLPPGPIRIPSIVCIDAVLNYTKHNYLFMAAKETFNGEHNFAATGEEHMRNARKYQKALNARGIH
ncbi:endolytic transglycosylase MltG [Paludibacter sp.]